MYTHVYVCVPIVQVHLPHSAPWDVQHAHLTTGPMVVDKIRTIGTTVEACEQFLSQNEVRDADTYDRGRESNLGRLV